MKKVWVFLLVIAQLVCVSAALAQSHPDEVEGSKDHPLFNRMKNYYIGGYETREFDAFTFEWGGENKLTAEGRTFLITYNFDGSVTQPSDLQIQRNFETALQKAGATIIYKGTEELGDYLRLIFKMNASGKEVHGQMTPFNGGSNYELRIIEKEAMRQEITVNAAELKAGLTATGHIAVYDILFDTGKSEVKPGSENTLKEIAKLLSQNPSLKLHVVGHTDNAGDLAANMKLSQARAAAVVAALTGKHGVAANRLTAFGAGPYSPVASNKTDDGKAKNRRVELVEQ